MNLGGGDDLEEGEDEEEEDEDDKEAADDLELTPQIRKLLKKQLALQRKRLTNEFTNSKTTLLAHQKMVRNGPMVPGRQRSHVTHVSWPTRRFYGRALGSRSLKESRDSRGSYAKLWTQLPSLRSATSVLISSPMRLEEVDPSSLM